ncbi:MAG: M23 family metallopeptidase [Acidobacteriota bacterium]
MSKVILPLVLLVCGGVVRAQRVTESALALTASEERCSVGKAVTVVDNTERGVFFRFLLARGGGQAGLTVEWLAPGGQVMEFVNYEVLPAAPLLCFVTQMPLAGFEQATRPGEWTVRVVMRNNVLHERKFTVRADPAMAAGLFVRGVSRVETGAGETELRLEGAGMTGESVVHLATYSAANAWQFLASMGVVEASRTEVRVRYGGKLSPGEYWVVVKNADGRQIAPARLVVASEKGYGLPTAAGEDWIVTQGPYGGTSHWGRSLHAWDLAPVSLRSGGCVVAMRGGLVHAYDRGERQNSYGRSFGNLITIEHDDGEFSHYAHLRTGSFVVRTGQRVEAGQALAMVGNSGHTLGVNGGYHVHVHVTRGRAAANPSIPFAFAGVGMVGKGRMVTNERPLVGNCQTRYEGAVDVSRREGTKGEAGPRWKARVGLAEWWTETFEVPRSARVLDIVTEWSGKESRRLDVYLTSPSGYQYGGPFQNPEHLRVEAPESGRWRISVQGVKGSGEAIDFEVWGKRGN